MSKISTFVWQVFRISVVFLFLEDRCMAITKITNLAFENVKLLPKITQNYVVVAFIISTLL